MVAVARLRAERLAEALKVEISDIIRNQVKDPRVGFASIVDVEVSSDLRHARVYVSILGGEEERAGALKGLESATGFIRSEVARRIRLRHAPELSFRIDESIARGVRIAELLGKLKEGEE